MVSVGSTKDVTEDGRLHWADLCEISPVIYDGAGKLSRHLLHIVIALCFSLNYVSLPCILFLFMQLQSRYIRKNHLLSRSCYLFSFLLSFFLSFRFSLFGVYAGRFVWGWICLICYRSSRNALLWRV